MKFNRDEIDNDEPRSMAFLFCGPPNSMERLGYAQLQEDKSSPQLLKSAKSFLDCLEKEGVSSELSKRKWNEIISELEEAGKTNFSGYADLEKAQAYRILASVRHLGFKTSIPWQLRQRPSDIASIVEWDKAERFMRLELW